MTNIWIAAGDGDFAGVKKCIEEDGMDVNSGDDTGYTPLQAAVSWNYKEIAEYLTARGANVNQQDDDGDTALHYCEDEKMAAWLIEQGADPTIKNGEGYMPIQKAFLDGLEGLVEFLKRFTPDADLDIEEDLGEQNISVDLEALMEEIKRKRESGDDDCIR